MSVDLHFLFQKISRLFYRRGYINITRFFRDHFSLEIPETEEKSLSHLLRRGMSQGKKKPGTSPWRYLRRRTVLPLILECAFVRFLFVSNVATATAALRRMLERDKTSTKRYKYESLRISYACIIRRGSSANRHELHSLPR